MRKFNKIGMNWINWYVPNSKLPLSLRHVPEINGVALSLLQLCKGLQQQGHKILLVRPQQSLKCEEFSPNKECLVIAQTLPKYPGLQFGWSIFEGK